MPQPRLTIAERQKRINHGRQIRFLMDERAIKVSHLLPVLEKMRRKKKKTISRHSIWLALYTDKLPTLRDEIANIVKSIPIPKVQ